MKNPLSKPPACLSTRLDATDCPIDTALRLT